MLLLALALSALVVLFTLGALWAHWAFIARRTRLRVRHLPYPLGAARGPEGDQWTAWMARRSTGASAELLPPVLWCRGMGGTELGTPPLRTVTVMEDEDEMRI
eukprot:7303427-Prymnesium_polylepis.1